MEELKDLISRYGLTEDIEHIIIPVAGTDGRSARCFLLKRKFIRIAYPDAHFEDFRLAEVVEALITYPHLPLRESLKLLHAEPVTDDDMVHEDKEGEKD